MSVGKLTLIATRQHGVFTREQAITCGISLRTIDRRIELGVWHRLHKGVYRLSGTPVTWRQSLIGACLACDAVVSHRAAAALWGLPGFPPGLIEVSREGKQLAWAGIIVHRVRSLDRIDVAHVDGVRVTAAARTLIDLAAIVPEDPLEEALDDALRRRLVTPRRLRRRLSDLGSKGRHGARTVWELLDARDGVSEVPQSVFETRLLRVLRRAALPLPVVQHRVETGRGRALIDFAYVEQLVAIEADGFRWHSSRRQWDNDRARRNDLTLLGWTVIHVTWPQLADRADEIVSIVRAALSGAQPPGAR